MLLNTEEIASPSSITESVTANATSPIRMAYSARSCPDSSVQVLSKFLIVATASFGFQTVFPPRAKCSFGETC